MVFTSKMDSAFKKMMGFAMGLIAVATLWPVVYEIFFTKEGTEWPAVFVCLGIFILLEALLFWISLDIRYVLEEDYLFVKGGPFRSKIPYEDITKVNHSNEILAGYRILSSKDALEIHYKKASLGSVIISPTDKEKFLEILLEKAPSIRYVK